MSKMFVHYSGTLAAFQSAKDTEGKALVEKYNNHIVFIKGGENGTGEAIFTHGKYFANAGALKYFSKVSDGSTIVEAAGPNGTLTFSATDPSLVAVNASAKGVTISLSQDFVDKVNNTAIALGAASDTANSSGSAFARISQLQSDIQSLTGGNGSISEQINNAINALDVDAKAGDFVASVKQVDGKIEATMGSFNFDKAGAAALALVDAKNYADGLAGNYEKAGEAAKAQSAAEKHADDLDSAMNTRVAKLEAIDHDKLASDAATSAVATVLDGAPEAFDTLKEVAEWIADSESAASAADLVTRVGALEKIDHDAYKAADETTLASAKAYAESEADAAEAAAKADAAEKYQVKGNYEAAGAADAVEAKLNTEKGRIDAIVADYLKAADKTALQNSIDSVSAVANAAAPQATTYTKAEVDALWEWEEL